MYVFTIKSPRIILEKTQRNIIKKGVKNLISSLCYTHIFSYTSIMHTYAKYECGYDADEMQDMMPRSVAKNCDIYSSAVTSDGHKGNGVGEGSLLKHVTILEGLIRYKYNVQTVLILRNF